MSFDSVSLENFRRFSKAEFSLAPNGITLITGPNGSGKSTILEAAYLLCMGRSCRDVRFSTLIHRESSAAYFRVQSASPNGQTGSSNIRSVSFLAGSAVAYQEGDKPVRRSDMIGRPPMVLFSAEELRLITGEPAMRRKFMDRILSQENPEYLARLKRYTRTLEERNALLKSPDSGPLDEESLLAIDETLAPDGDVLTAGRTRLIEDVKTALPEKLAMLGSSHLSHRIGIELMKTAPKDLLTSLIDHRRQDTSSGHTTVGPHRDDVLFSDQKFSAADTLSHGEIRILSLALKCIEADRLSRAPGPAQERPILLFDDLFSELDETRRSSVSAFLRNYPGQVLLTSCEAAPSELLEHVHRHISL